MNVRQDFTDLDKKVNSFVDFLRRLHEITLGQFGQLNQFYLRVKDLEDDNWRQNGENWREAKAEAALELFYGVLNIYRDVVDFNDLTLEVSTISWVIDDNSLAGIISGYLQMLNEELNTLWSMSPNDKEALIFNVIERNISTINRLRDAIGNTTRDGYSIYQEIFNFVYNSFDGENLNNLKRELFLTFEQALHIPAQDCFRTLLKAILKSDKIDVAIEEENKSFDEYSTRLNEEIAALTEKIQQLEGEIKEAMKAEQYIVRNNKLIEKLNNEKAEVEQYIQKLDSDEVSTQAQIAALDPTSETYEADLASLQATSSKIQSEKASQMDKISEYQAEIATRTANNAEFAALVDQLDEKQDELAYSQKDKMELTKEISEVESDHQAALERFERNRQDLPLDSSPSQRGGSVYRVLSDKIRVIDGIMVNASDYRGYPLKPQTSINVPGMPSFTNSVALDLDFGHVLSNLGFGNELISKFNFESPIEIANSGSYWSIFELMNTLHDNSIITERAKEFVDNYSSINFSNPVAESLRMEVNLEKLDAKKGEVDANLLKETTVYDALTQEISDTNSQIQNLEASREQLNVDIKATMDSIENYTASIENDTESLSQAQVTKADSESTKSAAEGIKAESQAAQATAEGVIDEAQATIAETEEKISGEYGFVNYIYNLEEGMTAQRGYIIDAQAVKATAEAEKAQYLADGGDDQAIIDGYDSTIANASSEIAERTANLVLSEEQLVIAKAGLVEAEATIKNATATIAEATATIAQAAATIAEAEDTIAQADATIAQAQSEIDVLILAIQSSTDSKMSAEASLNSLTEQSSTIENSLNELYSTMESLKEKLSIVEKAIAELTDFIDNYDADRASMVSFIDEMTVGYDQTLANYKLTLKQLYKVTVDINSAIEDSIQQITIVKSKSNIRNNRKEESN